MLDNKEELENNLVENKESEEVVEILEENKESEELVENQEENSQFDETAEDQEEETAGDLEEEIIREEVLEEEYMKEENLEEEDGWKGLAEGEEAEITKLKEFLEYSQIPAKVIVGEDEWLNIRVPEENWKEAKKLFAVYKKQVEEEKSNEVDEADDIQDEDEVILSSNLYSDEMDKVEDMKSSASAFLFVGILGLAVLTACAFGIIKLNMEGFSMYMFYTVMYAMLIVFIIVGIYSAVDVKKIKQKALEAKNKEQEILDWFISEYSAEKLDEGITETKEIEKYFPRAEKIKDILLEKEPSLNVEQIEKYLEEIYEKVFEDN